MSKPMLLGMDMLRRIQSVRPESLVSLWPQDEPLGHGVSTEIVRGYDGAYTAVTLGQPGVQGSGLTSAGYNGTTSFNNIYTAGFANDNLLLNPGFETAGGGGADIWANWSESVGDGTLANEVVIVHEGNDAAKLTNGATNNTNISQYAAGITEQNHRLRFWTRGDGVNEGRYGIYDNTNTNWIHNRIGTGVAGAVYAPVVVEFSVPANCIAFTTYFFPGSANGAIAYFDACEVRRMNGFLGDEGTLLVWAQVANAGVWTDGTTRIFVALKVDAENYIDIRRPVANNEISFLYEAGNTLETATIGGLTNTDFACYAMTWSKSGDAVTYYIDGAEVSVPDTALGTWVGDISNTQAVIGANDTVPNYVWSGNVGPVACWSEALSADEMRYLGT